MHRDRHAPFDASWRWDVKNEEPALIEESVVGKPPSEEKITKQPGPLGRFFIRVVRWAAGIGLVFGFGVVLTWLIRVAPLVGERRDLRDELAAANAHIADLEGVVSDLRDLEKTNASLQAELTSAELHIVLLNILSDISEARFALAFDDRAAAHAALTDTDELMSSLQEALGGEEANTVVGLRVRLLQAISEIDTDTFAADGDLEILANGLMNLEQKVFSD